MGLLRLVSRCERELRLALTDRIHRWGIHDVELLVLWLCQETADPGIAQSELVAEIGVSAAQVSGLVERLRRQKLLISKRCDSDRRKQYWTLTKEGVRLLDEIQADLSVVSHGLAKDLSIDEQRLLASLLQQLTRGAKQPFALRAVAPDANEIGQHREVHNDNTENDG